MSYFKPVRLGNNCSFVRKQKVTSWGIGLLQAVVSKYGVVEGVTAGVNEKDIKELQAEIGARFVEVVGFDKVNKQQSQVKHLRTVSVRNMGVSGRGENEQDLGEKLQSLKDIDLSDSLVNDWSELSGIINELQLHTIDLSGNLLNMGTLGDTNMASVSHLILGQMLYEGYSWSQILNVAVRMPSLTILQVHHNNIASIPEFESSKLAAITEIDLDGNKLTHWSEVQSLGNLPQLQHLRLNGNKLETLGPVTPGSFPKLESLQLTDNCVTNWSEVGHLDALSSLSQLRFRNNPVIASCKDEEVARQLTVARISSLKNLNGTLINQSERRWAEIDYLKTYGQKWIEISKMENEEDKNKALSCFLADFNRYDTIVKMFGEPEPGDGAKVDTSLKASLLRIKIRTPEIIGSAETVKKIPGSMNVRALRALLQRLYKNKTGGSKIRISLLAGDQEVVIDNDMREISFYSVSDGDIILVRWSQPPIVTDL